VAGARTWAPRIFRGQSRRCPRWLLGGLPPVHGSTVMSLAGAAWHEPASPLGRRSRGARRIGCARCLATDTASPAGRPRFRPQHGHDCRSWARRSVTLELEDHELGRDASTEAQPVHGPFACSLPRNASIPTCRLWDSPKRVGAGNSIGPSLTRHHACFSGFPVFVTSCTHPPLSSASSRILIKPRSKIQPSLTWPAENLGT
jgi:hypothetical protein